MKGVDIAIYAGTSLEKSLPFQAIPIVKIETTVLMVSLMMALIEDQIDDSIILLLSHPVFDDVLVSHNTKKRINIIALTFRNATMDKNIWKNIREVVYLVVLALPEILFQPTPMFWLNIMKERSNVFCCWLAYITIDETYLIWGWRNFCKKFSNIRIFRLVFPKILIIAVSVTMTPNTLKYVRKTLNLKTPVHLY